MAENGGAAKSSLAAGNHLCDTEINVGDNGSSTKAANLVQFAVQVDAKVIGYKSSLSNF